MLILAGRQSKTVSKAYDCFFTQGLFLRPTGSGEIKEVSFVPLCSAPHPPAQAAQSTGLSPSLPGLPATPRLVSSSRRQDFFRLLVLLGLAKGRSFHSHVNDVC